MSITTETRREAFLMKPTPRQTDILTILGDRAMTAREIAAAMCFSDLNAVKPRLTELKQNGAVEAVGKAFDMVTGRNVAVYKRKDPLPRV